MSALAGNFMPFANHLDHRTRAHLQASVLKANRETQLGQIGADLGGIYGRSIEPQSGAVLQRQWRNHLRTISLRPFGQALGKLLTGRQARARLRGLQLGNLAPGLLPTIKPRASPRHLLGRRSIRDSRNPVLGPSFRILYFGLIWKAVIGFFGLIQLFQPLIQTAVAVPFQTAHVSLLHSVARPKSSFPTTKRSS